MEARIRQPRVVADAYFRLPRVCENAMQGSLRERFLKQRTYASGAKVLAMV
jgi:hypothetical protein